MILRFDELAALRLRLFFLFALVCSLWNVVFEGDFGEVEMPRFAVGKSAKVAKCVCFGFFTCVFENGVPVVFRFRFGHDCMADLRQPPRQEISGVRLRQS